MELIKKLIYSQIIVFVLIISYFLVSFKYDITRPFFLILAILGITFLILGTILIIKARKEKGKLKFFLTLTGISAISPFLGSILHNFFYGLSIVFGNLKLFFEVLHTTFFIISLLIAPILFIIGVTGSIIIFSRKN